MASDGADAVYALAGGSTTEFWGYSITDDDWTPLDDTPATVSAGGALSFQGGWIYALGGGSTRDFWRYSAGASRYQIIASAEDHSLTVLVEIAGGDLDVLRWDAQ
jgi:hypothetical protein